MGGARRPPLLLDQTEAQRAEKFFGKIGTPTSFSKGLDDRPTPQPLISRCGSGTDLLI